MQLTIALSFTSVIHLHWKSSEELLLNLKPQALQNSGTVQELLMAFLSGCRSQALMKQSVGVDQKKFLCGCKHKFGLNCQAISDCRSRILDISIKCGGASSNCLAFEASELHRRLENGLMQQDAGNYLETMLT